MFQTALMSNTASLSEEASASSGTTRVLVQDLACFNPMPQSISCLTTHQDSKKIKKKRSLPGNPDPDAEVIALSPRALLATNRFVCEICNKGFQRDQNLQLHRRGHNLPWKLKQRSNKEVRKKAYVCPEQSCVHHHPSRALGDLTGIKKHFCRKHGEKKFKCDKCQKVYAVYSDWKAHSKTCGTREYRCDCGTLFSRKDSFVTHRAFCDALAEESARLSAASAAPSLYHPVHHETLPFGDQPAWEIGANNNSMYPQNPNHNMKYELLSQHSTPPLHVSIQSGRGSSSNMSATALLQKACSMGAISSCDFPAERHLTRDFLGLTPPPPQYTQVEVSMNMNMNMNMHDVLKYAGSLGSTTQLQPINLEQRDHSFMLKRQQHQAFGFAPSQTSELSSLPFYLNRN